MLRILKGQNQLLCVRTESCADMEKRDVVMSFRVTPTEATIIRERINDAGMKKPGAYLRKMALDGYVIKLDLQDVKEVTRLMRITSNNINQYTKKANETGSIYLQDIQEVKNNQKKLWELLRNILEHLSTIK